LFAVLDNNFYCTTSLKSQMRPISKFANLPERYNKIFHRQVLSGHTKLRQAKLLMFVVSMTVEG